MRMRRTYLRQGQTMSDSGTLIVDLNMREPISALELIFEATNGATSNQGVELADDIDSIELVDGAEVIFSMSGVQARALNYFETGGIAPHFHDEGAASVQKQLITINFGRYKGDPEFYLDPMQFRNPQLKITSSLTISATAGFATGTLAVDIIALAFSDRPPSLLGYLASKEVFNWSTLASGDTRINMPVDYPYRLIMARCREDGVLPTVDLSNLKLAGNNDEHVVFDLETAHMELLNIGQYGRPDLTGILFRTDGDAWSSAMGHILGASVQSILDLNIASVDAITYGQLTLQVLSVTVAPGIAKETDDTNIKYRITGSLPDHAVAYPFGDLYNPEQWLKANEFRSMDLKATNGGADGAASIVLQQVRG